MIPVYNADGTLAGVQGDSPPTNPPLSQIDRAISRFVIPTIISLGAILLLPPELAAVVVVVCVLSAIGDFGRSPRVPYLPRFVPNPFHFAYRPWTQRVVVVQGNSNRVNHGTSHLRGNGGRHTTHVVSSNGRGFLDANGIVHERLEDPFATSHTNGGSSRLPNGATGRPLERNLREEVLDGHNGPRDSNFTDGLDPAQTSRTSSTSSSSFSRPPGSGTIWRGFNFSEALDLTTGGNGGNTLHPNGATGEPLKRNTEVEKQTGHTGPRDSQISSGNKGKPNTVSYATVVGLPPTAPVTTSYEGANFGLRPPGNNQGGPFASMHGGTSRTSHATVVTNPDSRPPNLGKPQERDMKQEVRDGRRGPRDNKK